MHDTTRFRIRNDFFLYNWETQSLVVAKKYSNNFTLLSSLAWLNAA